MKSLDTFLTEAETLPSEKEAVGVSSDLQERSTFKRRVSSKGKVTKRRNCPSGFKASGNKCVRIKSAEKLTRKKGQKKRRRTIKSKGSSFQKRVARKRRIAIRKRKARGFKNRT